MRRAWRRRRSSRRAFGDDRADGGNGNALPQGTPDQEALIQAITDRVMAMLNKR